MARQNSKPAPFGETRGVANSRRHALALMLGAGRWLPAPLAAADASAPIRLAISDSVLGDVNLNDARVAMQIWIRRVTQDMNVVIDPKVFHTTQEIIDRTRKGQLDAVALNVVEYRQIADLLDSSQLISEAGAAGLAQYILLAKRNTGIEQLGDLRGRRLCTLKAPRTCVAPAWLSTILDDGHFGQSEEFFGSVTTDAKVSQVVLPVFFGRADACLTSKRGFDTMCELNPQVARDLKVLASSPAMVVNFYIFCKNYLSAQREIFIKALSSLRASPEGRQLATLFQFEELTVKDASCLAGALSVLARADRARNRRGAGSQKG